MKTRKTTFVAVLSQTLTTSCTTTSRSYSASRDEGCDGLSQVVTPVGGAPRWCEECATPIVLMSPEQAATVCFQTTRAIYRLVEAGRVHFTDGPEGVFVCPASLMSDWYGDQAAALLTAAPMRLAGFKSKAPEDIVV